jgi:hypothetical protein
MLSFSFFNEIFCYDKFFVNFWTFFSFSNISQHMATFSNNLVAFCGKKVANDFYCEFCDYKCCKKYNWEKHISTTKHKSATNSNNLATDEWQKWQKGQKQQFTCENCEKKYKDRTGLWRHKKNCVIKENTESSNNNNDEITDKEIIKSLINHTEKLMKIVENGTNNTTNSNNTTNINNKTFNLQFFLNETCKDALNIQEFVSSIKVNLDDLENTGRQGYIQGITNIFLKNLNNLENNERPIHCSDIKREVLYIKDDNQWIKESDQKPILTKAIKTIANENIKKIKNWKEMNPDCTDPDSKKNNLFLKIVSNSMNGLTKEEADKNINKIISNVAKEVIIEK